MLLSRAQQAALLAAVFDGGVDFALDRFVRARIRDEVTRDGVWKSSGLHLLPLSDVAAAVSSALAMLQGDAVTRLRAVAVAEVVAHVSRSRIGCPLHAVVSRIALPLAARRWPRATTSATSASPCRPRSWKLLHMPL